MIKMLKYLMISLLLLLSAFNAAAQYTIDKVCVGTERYYRVTGDAGSTYSWSITKPGGFVEPQLSDRDTIGITWNVIPGVYSLSVVQHAANGCDANMELGTVEVYAHPVASAGNNFTTCSASAITLIGATAQNYSGVVWSTSGDGTFADNTILNAVYMPGVNDQINGSVTLTLTASGLGNSGTCQPATSIVHINFISIGSSASSTPASCNGAQNGSVTLSASGGIGPYSYSLNGTNNSTGIFNNLAPGTYTYLIIDSQSCSSTGEVIVETSSQITAMIQAQNSDCFGAANGSIQVIGATGGSGNYEYSLDNINWQSSAIFSGLIAGNYNVYVRDSLIPACSITAGTVEITEPSVLNASINHTNISVPGANDGTITVVNSSGGSGTYEYSLDGNSWQSSGLFTGLSAGNYLVYIRDAVATNCSRIIGVILLGDGMTLNIVVQNASCFGQSDGQATAIVSGGNPPYTYSWNDPNSQSAATATNLSAGIYTVIVTDSLGISLSATDTLTEPMVVTPLLLPVSPLCLNSVAPALPDTSLNGIQGTWVPASISTADTGIVTYTFTPLPGECAVSASINVEVTNGITPQFAPFGPICHNEVPPLLPVVSLNGINGRWSPATISTDSIGVFNYTFIPNPGQCAMQSSLEIIVSGPRIDNVRVFTSTNGLSNGRAVVQVSGSMPPYNYSLDGTNWQVSPEFTDLAAGTYTAWVRDANGCISMDEFVILNMVTGEVGVLAGDVESCITLPFEIPVLAYDFTNISAFSIQLHFDSTVVAFNGLSQINSLLQEGNLEAEMITPGTLQITFTANDSVSLFSEDLLFLLNFQGLSSGRTDMQWQWLQCYIYSSSGYEIPAIYTKGTVMIRPAPLFYTEGAGSYCEGTPLTLDAKSYSGADYAYVWTDPQGYTHKGHEWDLGELTLDESGKYYIKAYDSTACYRTTWMDVKVNPKPLVQLAESDTLCSEEAIVLTPGAGFKEYYWQDGTSQPQLVATDQGLYWVIVTDLNGCMGGDSVLVHPCELVIWMPNAFSPNNDGLNDEFLARYNLNVDINFQMIIYNKWGQEIYRSDDVTKGWDGTFKGVPCPPDLYTWTISFQAPPTYNFIQKSPMSGNVMLLK